MTQGKKKVETRLRFRGQQRQSNSPIPTVRFVQSAWIVPRRSRPRVATRWARQRMDDWTLKRSAVLSRSGTIDLPLSLGNRIRQRKRNATHCIASALQSVDEPLRGRRAQCQDCIVSSSSPSAALTSHRSSVAVLAAAGSPFLICNKPAVFLPLLSAMDPFHSSAAPKV